MKLSLLKKKNGFSLVELMVVVEIIGILAALAIPKFQAFQAKAKASESKSSLAHVHTLQNIYQGDNQSYGTLQQIGFSLNGQAAAADALAANQQASIRYAYAGAEGVTTFSTLATATIGALGGCQTANHVVNINDANQISGAGVTVNGALTITGC